MSQSTKRKHVTQEVLFSDYRLPNDLERIVRVVAGRGNNLHEVFDPKEEAGKTNYLVSMPTKFRKNVWIKRGDFIMVQPIEEGDKVKAEISHILVDKHHIKYIKQTETTSCEKKINPNGDDSSRSQSSEDEDDDDDDLFVNTNRPQVDESESESGSSSEEGEDEN